ncbi:MAG: LacI family transcriptional regulator [Armatimonadetes bacterium]|nr:LacI family transcriptional regulator [Armatimonadota bacterium]
MACFNVKPSSGSAPIAATLKDIADRLGVSAQAVSLALNKSAAAGRISPELRERAVALAQEMGYRPNRLARALVRGRSHFIGLLMLASVDHPYVDALRGVDEEAAVSGYGVFLCNAHGRKTAREQMQTFAENCVEGIIAVASSSVGLTDEVLARKPEGVPLISINRDIRAPHVFSILMDNHSAVRQATEHLIRLGHRHIAYLDQTRPSPDRPLQSSVERREGYLAAMHAAGLAPLVRSLPAYAFELRVAESARVAHELLTGAEPPTAFCGVTDWEMVGALRACHALGLRVPDDVMLFGFDDREVGRWTQPALSTVRPAFHEAGRLAVRRLLEWEGDAEPSVCRLDCELVFRASAPEAPET